MKSSALLDSAVFQLTPTRTRCDLVINSNGKTEKITSGLLSPFLAHLKSAQMQMAKGGYSIVLDPGPNGRALWFTKGIVERFIRFVSTPEVLERVYSLESEILQMKEAILIQNKKDNALTMVEEQSKPVQSIEGSRPILDMNEEKAIVLYKPGTNPSEAKKSTSEEGQSRVQLLKVLKTRKKVLHKEQGMAFARAAAAGFDIDNMSPLISFAETFGASRLMEACTKFTELWKRKRETGQWMEIEAAEARSGKSELPTMSDMGVMADKQQELRSELPAEHNGRSTDGRPTTDHQASKGEQEFFQGQIPHQMYPPWPVHSPPGTLPLFPYPVQGMPYHHNHPGNGPYFQPPYMSSEDLRVSADRRMRHYMDSRDRNTESETWEVNPQKERSKDDSELNDSHEEAWRKQSRSSKRKSGVVVIRNLNYITSKRLEYSGSDSQSASGSEIDEDENLHGCSLNTNHNESLRSSGRKDICTKSVDTLNFPDKEDTAYGKDDSSHWQAFQNCLLRGADDDNQTVDKGIFAVEKGVQVKRRNNKAGSDPLIFDGENMRSTYQDSTKDIYELSANETCMQSASNDVLLISRRGNKSCRNHNSVESYIDDQTTGMNSRRRAYKSAANDEIMFQKQENQSGLSSSDPLSMNRFELGNHSLDGKREQNVDEGSYIVPFRSPSLDQVGIHHRNTIDMDSEFPTAHKQEKYLPKGSGRPSIYEPVDLSLIPERNTEHGSMSYDPMQVIAEGGTRLGKKIEEAGTVQKKVAKSDKDCRSKHNPEKLDRKKNVGPITKAKPSKLSPLDEAKARADKLRSFKADLQKMKKEREEENMKRLEALKLERQKRIAAKGTSYPTESKLCKQQARKQVVPSKFSPTTYKGSKFSDAEPGSSSPLQRSIKTNRLTGSSSGGNRLIPSGSSLPKAKKDDNDVKPETKVSMARIRRLSEPKMSSNHIVSSAMSTGKARSAESTSKSKASNVSESKKILAVMKLDHGKAGTLPELRIRAHRNKHVTQSKLAGNVSLEKVDGTKSYSSTKGAEMNSNMAKIPDHNDADENPVIEKTVVMLEYEKPSLPQSQASKEKTGTQKGPCNDIGDTKKVSSYSPIHVLISPFTRDEADGKLNEHQFHDQVKMSDVGNASPQILRTSTSEKPYQAPHTQVSCPEDPSTTNSAYSQEPLQTVRVATAGNDAVTVHDSDSKDLNVEKISEALEKSRGKESSKGFKRILNFGRKNPTSSPVERKEPGDASVGGSAADDNAGNAYSSGEVHTLKNLISQDETPTVRTTPKKSPRTFSLLSPFRSKTRRKRPVA